jgi:hypothetical protein
MKERSVHHKFNRVAEPEWMLWLPPSTPGVPMYPMYAPPPQDPEAMIRAMKATKAFFDELQPKKEEKKGLTFWQQFVLITLAHNTAIIVGTVAAMIFIHNTWH